MIKQFDSLFDLMDAFPDEQACVDHLRSIRWRDGEFCPLCVVEGQQPEQRIYHFSDRKTFKCGECRRRFSIKVGTIFEDTKLPLRKWFMAIWMITNHPKGIASVTLAKDLKVTQKSAWFMLHRLRHAARTPSFNAPLKGEVEIDETYVGGKSTNRHGRRSGVGGGAVGKTPVVGAVERGGELVAKVIPVATRAALQGFIKETVDADADLLATDAHPAYRKLTGYKNHQVVNHHRGEYRKGDAHTNSIESVWALLKRQIIGIHHWVSPKHLDRYVSEMAWRYNRRDMKVTPRMNDMFGCVEGRLTYKALIQ